MNTGGQGRVACPLGHQATLCTWHSAAAACSTQAAREVSVTLVPHGDIYSLYMYRSCRTAPDRCGGPEDWGGDRAPQCEVSCSVNLIVRRYRKSEYDDVLKADCFRGIVQAYNITY